MKKLSTSTKILFYSTIILASVLLMTNRAVGCQGSGGDIFIDIVIATIIMNVSLIIFDAIKKKHSISAAIFYILLTLIVFVCLLLARPSYRC